MADKNNLVMAHYPNSLNPFLDDFEDDTESYYSVNMEPPQYDPPPPPGRFVNMKLPAFWSDAPVAWFAAVEAQFQLRQVTSQSERFCHLTAALDKASLKKVVHIVTAPDPLRPYTVLKEALLTSHHMTDFQRVELLHAMEPLGGRKPSELLADMLELCPPTQHNNVFFAVLFLQRLPREIRVLLTHEDHTDLRRLAAHADCLVAFGGGQQSGHAAITAEDTEENTIAAIKGKPTPQLQKNKYQKQQRSRQPPPLPPRPQDDQSGTTNPSPSNLARQSSGLCFYHWAHGEKAHSCKSPCTWQGN